MPDGTDRRLMEIRAMEDNIETQATEFFQTKVRGTNDQEYQIYLACANDGKGGDITRGGAPLKSYDEWLNS